jgi:hypothetical protein
MKPELIQIRDIIEREYAAPPITSGKCWEVRVTEGIGQLLESLIQQARQEAAREYERKLAGQEVAFGFLSEGIRDATIREVFAYMEKVMIHLAASDTWQDLKSKYQETA